MRQRRPPRDNGLQAVQGDRAAEFARRSSTLDYSVNSIQALGTMLRTAGSNEVDIPGASAYLGEVLLRATRNGAWETADLEGVPLPWVGWHNRPPIVPRPRVRDMILEPMSLISFAIGERESPSLLELARDLVKYVRRPTPAVRARLGLTLVPGKRFGWLRAEDQQ